MESTSLAFAAAVRSLAVESRRLGLTMPAFRAPPTVPDVDRTLRRRGDGGFTVAVRITGRPWAAVLADMVDGIIATNELHPAKATARAELWKAVCPESASPSDGMVSS